MKTIYQLYNKLTINYVFTKVYKYVPHLALFSLFFYLGYIYFFDFNQGVSSAPIAIKSLKDILVALFLLLNFKITLRVIKKKTFLFISIPIFMHFAFSNDLTSMINQRNLLYSFIIGLSLKYMNDIDIILKRLIKFIILISFLLFPLSPWQYHAMVGPLGSPVNFYFFTILIMIIYLQRYLETPNMYNLSVAFIATFASYMSGSLAAFLISNSIFIFFTLFYYFKNKTPPIQLLIIHTLIIIFCFIFFPNLMSKDLILILLHKIPFINDYITLNQESSLSITNRVNQLNGVNTLILVNFYKPYIKSDFQYVEILVNQGIISFLFYIFILFKMLLRSLYSKSFEYISIVFLILTIMVFSPILRYIPAGIFVIYYIDKFMKELPEITLIDIKRLNTYLRNKIPSIILNK